MLILRAIQPDDPRLLKLWEETFNERRKGTSIAQYYDDYPILKCSIATLLVILYKICVYVCMYGVHARTQYNINSPNVNYYRYVLIMALQQELILLFFKKSGPKFAHMSYR